MKSHRWQNFEYRRKGQIELGKYTNPRSWLHRTRLLLSVVLMRADTADFDAVCSIPGPIHPVNWALAFSARFSGLSRTFWIFILVVVHSVSVVHWIEGWWNSEEIVSQFNHSHNIIQLFILFNWASANETNNGNINFITNPVWDVFSFSFCPITMLMVIEFEQQLCEIARDFVCSVPVGIVIKTIESAHEQYSVRE